MSVLSRSAEASAHKIEGADYISGDLASRETIERVFRDVRPSVIIHAATPSPLTGMPKKYQRVVIDGTKSRLDIAKISSDVRVLVYTSSSSMAKGYERLHLDESTPLADEDPWALAYARTKATAEKMVLKAHNGLSATTLESNSNWSGRLCTGAIRLPICYGTHNIMSIPGCLTALANGHTKPTERVVQLPVWFIWSLANVLEWLFWVFTLGTKQPQTLGKQQIEYSCYSHTYDVSKTRKRLRYVSVQDFEADLGKAVDWTLKEDGWGERLKEAGVNPW